MTPHPTKFLAAVLLCLGVNLAWADPTVTVSPRISPSIQGSLEAGKEESWKLIINSGKEARVSVVKGKPGVAVDIYDAQDITANEGVSEEDWFPVQKGQYRITVTNTTALGAKAAGRTVVYEIRIEAR